MFIEIASFFVFTYIIVNEKNNYNNIIIFQDFEKKQNISLPQFPVKFSFSDHLELLQFLVSAYVEKYIMLWIYVHFLSLDVDECADNSHNCPATSVCNNTVDSFICTCYALLFEWDGTNCSGKHRYYLYV